MRTLAAKCESLRQTSRSAHSPETAVTPSRDVVIVNQPRPPANPVTADIRVTASDAVHLSAFGLDTNLKGSVRVRQGKRGSASGFGSLSLVNGEFTAYGQTLQIAEGQLIFDGPLDNPQVQLRAVRQATIDGRPYEAILVVSGFANQLESEVSSRPATSEADALSILLTGRRLNDQGAGEVDLAQAATTLGIKSAGRITDQLASTFGLSELSVSGGEDGVVVGAGVALRENLYLKYTYNVFTRLGGALLTMELSDQWGLQATSGDSQSIELTYDIER